MKGKKGGELICKRPEIIIEARYALTKRQNDILDMVLATIDDDDNKFRYQIDLSMYGKLYNLKNKSAIYNELKKTVKTFEGKGFAITQKISEKKENRIYFSWFSSIRYLDGEARIEIELGQTLKEIMLNSKKACFYQIKYPLNFNSIYSKRLYYNLKSFENSIGNKEGWRIDNLNELRAKLECPKSYNTYYEFKRLVLRKAEEEINGNSDIEFDYEELKIKGKVISLKFHIRTNIINKTNETSNIKFAISSNDEVSATTISESPCNDLIKQVQGICNRHKITDHEASCILSDANNNIGLIKNRYDYLLTQKKVDNVVGYMRSIIVTYDKAQKNIKIDNFNNFEQREYDFEKLENNLSWQK